MVGAIAVGRQCAAKVGCGKTGDLVSHTHVHRSAVQRGHGITDAAQKRGVLGDKTVVQIKTTDGHKKHLTPRAQNVAAVDQAGYHFHLL